MLNDCSTVSTSIGDTIKLTLLKSALAPDSHADQGLQTFTYGVYVWQGPFAESDVIRQGYDLNAPLFAVPGDGGTKSLFTVDAPSVVIETVKPAEDGSTDIIVRLYESKRMAVACSLATTLPVRSACCTDMLESAVLTELPIVDATVALEFRPFEVKTVRLRL